MHDTLNVFATYKSVSTGVEILYGVIDGIDSARLIKAYPDHFQWPAEPPKE
jgi:hypothetical protein